MEFDFRKDLVTQKVDVKISMGHEAFATWLEMEGQSLAWVQSLLLVVAQCQKHQRTEFKLIGSEFTLQLTPEEALITNNRLLENEEVPTFEEEFSFYNLEIEAGCGLEDFLNLLNSWREFIEE
ncbi:YacL family protein [Psychromonas sp. CD1]|uniref:YacL family protein n=1 Tax=Psychromonas sp. CD1 TaxID=1979839 RepID=UPI000B9A46D3|nr:YacL family protein [Psychromonas sp. CD1]